MRDTIYAPATATGRGAVAVVRVSGPAAGTVVSSLCGRLPAPRRAALRRLRSGAEVLDEALVLWMPGPGSFTGEDCAELQTHGGPAVVEAVCNALAEAGARLAEAGEFTRRAFEAGRLDLTQAEAVADLVDAETQAQRRQATAQLSGALTGRYQAWREALLDTLAMIEAGIDFPEDDIPGGVVSEAMVIVERVRHEIRTELGDARGERVRGGLRVALIGSPNVGKSSLLNALAGRDAAIVTPLAGTTRDVVEVHLQLNGQAVVLADTAGLRETADAIEQEGVSRAQRWALQADLRLAVGDASRPATIDTACGLLNDGDILVVNKTDLASDEWASIWPTAVGAVASPDGVEHLRARLIERSASLTAGADFPAITRQRHRDLLSKCVVNLDRAGDDAERGPELAGEAVRLAIRDLERVTGRFDPEEVLDRVFSRFCIGK